MSYSYLIRKAEIDEFKSTWPCHGIPNNAWNLWARWSNNGDLIEYQLRARNGRDCNTEHCGEALQALIFDMQAQCIRDM